MVDEKQDYSLQTQIYIIEQLLQPSIDDQYPLDKFETLLQPSIAIQPLTVANIMHLTIVIEASTPLFRY